MSFSSLGLIEPLVRAVEARGYTQPTPIQSQAIPAVLSGGDLLAGAQTGTGKTAGFTLPLLQRLHTTPARKPKSIRALILTPTRELAAQVEESVRNYGANLELRSMVMFGGVSINPQIAALKRGVDVLVATPGRLLDHVQQKTVDLSGVEVLVLDEADRMLDMGFIHDIKKVLALLPKQRQNLLFSATFSDEIKALADGLLNKPALIEVARRNATQEAIVQRVMLVDQKAKRHLLAHLIKEHQWFQVLVFTRTKHGANRLAEQLTKAGIPSLAIHGNKSQNARTRALSEFKSGELQVLVATDIAARGLDIVELPHVVNFELPNVPEDYVHRIGRTGRAGASGEALSLVAPDEQAYLRDIEKLTKQSIERVTPPAFEIPSTAAAEDAQPRPPRQPRGQPRARGGNAAAKEGNKERNKPRGERSGQPVARAASKPPVEGESQRVAVAVPAEGETRVQGEGGQREGSRRRRGRSGGEGAARNEGQPRRDAQGEGAAPRQPRGDGGQRRGEGQGRSPQGRGQSGEQRSDQRDGQRNNQNGGRAAHGGRGGQAGNGGSDGQRRQGNGGEGRRRNRHGAPIDEVRAQQMLGNRAPRQHGEAREVDGNRAPPPPREVNGNVIEKPRREVDGNRATREGKSQDGLRGMLSRGMNALRRFGDR